METFQNIAVGLAVFVGACILFVMAFRPGVRDEKFIDADADGEPDETPDEKRRALECYD